MRKNGFAPILILIGTLIAGVLVGGAYYLGKSQAPKPQTQNPAVVSQTPAIPAIPKPSPSSKYVAPTITKNNETLTPEAAARIQPLDETAK